MVTGIEIFDNIPKGCQPVCMNQLASLRNSLEVEREAVMYTKTAKGAGEIVPCVYRLNHMTFKGGPLC